MSKARQSLRKRLNQMDRFSELTQYMPGFAKLCRLRDRVYGKLHKYGTQVPRSSAFFPEGHHEAYMASMVDGSARSRP